MRPLPPVEQVTGGVWSVPVVVPDNPIGWTQAYVLESSAGPFLVDTGWNAPAAWDGLRAGLVAAGTSVEEVQGVVITHHHPDHLGLAGLVREASGCWVGMHAADTDLVTRHRELLEDDPEVMHAGTQRLLLEAGAGSCEAAEVDAARALSFPLPVLPDRDVDTGVLQLGDRAVRLIHTPGHTPGHLCLYLDDVDLLLTGDHLLSTITSHVGLYGFESAEADPLGDYLASLHRLEGREPAQVLPAHRGRFHGVSDRVEVLVAHHDERLAELKEALAAGPCTPWQLCHAMTWNRPWPEIPVLMRRAALAEVMAHVRHLEHEGLAVVDPGPPVVVRLA
jgi:glyoxylase-like metal-dependent hydrolase (beta-lactamase superfamily II)